MTPALSLHNSGETTGITTLVQSLQASPMWQASCDVAADRILVRRCQRGDEAATVELVERFQRDVYGVCLRLLADPHEAEDVAQEVFLRVFRSLGSWDGERPLRPWIMAIAVNRCRTFLGKRQRRPRPTEDLSEQPARADEAQPHNELLSEIRLALAGVRPEFQEVFVLFHEQGWPYEWIAQVMDRPVGTIKTWLHRVRLQVLDHLRSRGMLHEVTDVDVR
ncbi:MAG TPA: sigma-70 family RNA polymerase sigma factor [Gemmatales bacterium]|nr:sigma-70 family RNA polymerase sigma factor [Gemmatales bacterium]